MLWPALVAIADLCQDVAVAEMFEVGTGHFAELWYDLDRVHLACEHGKDCRLISGPRAHLQDPVRLRQLQQFRHQSDDKRLRDRLAVAYRERCVSISGGPVLWRHELVSRHLDHCGAHTRAEPSHTAVPADASIASISSTIRRRSTACCCAAEAVTSTAQVKIANRICGLLNIKVRLSRSRAHRGGQAESRSETVPS